MKAGKDHALHSSTFALNMMVMDLQAANLVSKIFQSPLQLSLKKLPNYEKFSASMTFIQNYDITDKHLLFKLFIGNKEIL